MKFSHEERREYVIAALDRYERQLTRYASRMLGGNLEQAADVVQSTFMKLCEQDQKKDDRQLKAWLYTVCRNRIIDDFRKNGRQTYLDPTHFDTSVGMEPDPQQNIEQLDFVEQIKHRINHLPPIDREIVDLWSHGLKHREIAEVVGKKPVSIRVQLHRIIQQLKNEFGQAANADCTMQNAE